LAYSIDNSLQYKGYRIESIPQKNQDGNWTINIEIQKSIPNGIDMKPYSTQNSFESIEDAISAGFEFGIKIINGNIPNCSPP
jgi:hypothetical protein